MTIELKDSVTDVCERRAQEAEIANETVEDEETRAAEEEKDVKVEVVEDVPEIWFLR